ncbi:hypothetical protein [Helicobacter pylori]|uniref:hypothetical protein n=1 Tax=Helicobacter pylori TaxID=210 RepID=UPI001F09E97B|nr:hypothetical protein [Helicobacter pylori]
MIILSAISRVFWLKNTKAGSYQFMELNIHQNTKYKLWLRFHWILTKSYFYGIFMGYKKNTQRKR